MGMAELLLMYSYPDENGKSYPSGCRFLFSETIKWNSCQYTEGQQFYAGTGWRRMLIFSYG